MDGQVYLGILFGIRLDGSRNLISSKVIDKIGIGKKKFPYVCESFLFVFLLFESKDEKEGGEKERGEEVTPDIQHR